MCLPRKRIFHRAVSETHELFHNLDEAESKIGPIRTPDMPEAFKIQKITYDNNGFTSPVTKVYYDNHGHQIIFMIASSWFDDKPAQKIAGVQISDITWITTGNEYVLKWRNSNQESYKYLFTKEEKDKLWLISLAEQYERQKERNQ
ncbi:MAG: hypothetical protein H0Z33_10545 [Bacillaceae bacterium]|nr:hypothetical protein [Bacillaceae bacterium]